MSNKNIIVNTSEPRPGLLARAICHELDHLDGILYKDVADSPLRDVEYNEPEAE